ncbi:spidroin-2-like [Amphibalanus amphitrite]|uniref:spidroin-2-like n=1 Tax=Amphibalanus amphitrite TaxID=1232801 RepID=UPI001C929FBD|nr:spidroin-2-like [Amphibalanus amphitrite]
MRCVVSVCLLLLGVALVGAAPSLLPGDPNYSEHDHGHHGEHAHGEHAHGEHAHGEHAHDGQAHPEHHAHEGQAHDGQAHAGQAHSGQAHDGQAHPEGQAHAGQAHPEGQAHAGQAHPGHAHDGQAHPGQAHPEEQAHAGQAHAEGQAQDGFPAFPGQAFPGQAFPGQAFPGQAFAGQAFPGQEFPGQNPGQVAADVAAPAPVVPAPAASAPVGSAPVAPAPGSSLSQGIPDLPTTYATGAASADSTQVSSGGSAAPVQQTRPSNPFLSGSLALPPSSSFQVAVKPVPPPAQRPTPEPIKELNTNPLGGPAGPKGPVRASCPGPASALPCVPDEQCDPYTGFLKSDGVKLPYPITKDTPTVAIGQCKLGAGVGVCCKKFPRPAPTTTTTAVPLGVDYGQGLEHLKKPTTERPPNPFLPDYKPTY